MRKKLLTSEKLKILLEFIWKKIFISFIKLIKYYIYSTFLAVIIANMFINGWSKTLGHGTVSYTDFWNLQKCIFIVLFIIAALVFTVPNSMRKEE
jgi:putative Ca2+/H+ antiporter (TMEM165/GDT1 family)